MCIENYKHQHDYFNIYSQQSPLTDPCRNIAIIFRMTTSEVCRGYLYLHVLHEEHAQKDKELDFG